MTDSCYYVGISCDPICDHGVLTSRERCLFCEQEKDINALRDHKLRQIDENRKISKRVDELEKTFADFIKKKQSHYYE